MALCTRSLIVHEWQAHSHNLGITLQAPEFAGSQGAHRNYESRKYYDARDDAEN
jgi:hypothetical protein